MYLNKPSRNHLNFVVAQPLVLYKVLIETIEFYSRIVLEESLHKSICLFVP